MLIIKTNMIRKLQVKIQKIKNNPLPLRKLLRIKKKAMLRVSKEKIIGKTGTKKTTEEDTEANTEVTIEEITEVATEATEEVTEETIEENIEVATEVEETIREMTGEPKRKMNPTKEMKTESSKPLLRKQART